VTIPMYRSASGATTRYRWIWLDTIGQPRFRRRNHLPRTHTPRLWAIQHEQRQITVTAVGDFLGLGIQLGRTLPDLSNRCQAAPSLNIDVVQGLIQRPDRYRRPREPNFRVGRLLDRGQPGPEAGFQVLPSSNRLGPLPGHLPASRLAGATWATCSRGVASSSAYDPYGPLWMSDAHRSGRFGRSSRNARTTLCSAAAMSVPDATVS
jgi:hypothetical protein